MAIPPTPADFQGVDVGSQTTLFYRETPQGVEGFVVDNEALVRTLKERVLTQRGLSELVDVTTFSNRSMSSVSAPTASHQFADPFTAVHADLHLAPLEVSYGEQLLLPLTGGLALLIIFGLWALYRVVKTQLAFAERQSNFVAAVSHELKTPLTAIRMHGEMLRDGLVEDRAKEQESFRTITAQAERLSRLIGNILLLSKIERTVPPEPRRADLVQIVEEATSAILPHVEKSGFSLQLDIPSSVPAVLLDADAVEQILFNLVDNSLKYAKGAEDKRLSVSVEVLETGVLLTVRDRGPGIPESEHARVFEPFYRLESELTRTNQGTGLGLALVRDLAQQMNATVSAENAQPGLTVTVEFQKA